MKFSDKFRACAAKNQSLLCVGLDNPSFAFNQQIIDQTHDLVCAYKPNTAFYEAVGSSGIAQLQETCHYIQDRYPEIPIIIDAKRGDIGNTNQEYAKFVFTYLGADAVTLQPYQGLGALSPFEEYKDKGLIALVKTSNPESGELQDLSLAGGQKVWEQVLAQVAARDAGTGQWGVVVGATHPTEMEMVRRAVGKMIVLAPGVGAQGAQVSDILNERTSHGGDIIINVSRGVIQAEDPRVAAKALQLQTKDYAKVRR